jgi:hypothetical protein
MIYKITAISVKGERITRTAFSGLQAFTIINQLHREGCKDIGMKEENYE